MIIDLEQTKLVKEKEYDKRIESIEKKFKVEREARKEVKIKHAMKFESTKHKQDQIQRDIEEQQRKLLERQDKDMQQKIKKHEYIEKSRCDQLRRREEEFERKRSKIESMKRERETEELRNVEFSLKIFENKISEGNQKHNYQI